MNIGEVSDYLKITKKAINLYEEKGLLRPNKNMDIVFMERKKLKL